MRKELFAPEKEYIHLDPGQWAYQQMLLCIEKIGEESLHWKSTTPVDGSKMSRLDNLIYPFSISRFITHQLESASENMQMVGRDIQRNYKASFSHAHYTLIRSAIEQLGVAISLLEGKDWDRINLSLRLSESNYKRELSYLKELIANSKLALETKPKSWSSIYDYTFEQRSLASNEDALEALNKNYASQKEALVKKHKRRLSSFDWGSLETITNLLPKANRVFSGNSDVVILGGNILTAWQICSGSAHGKEWSHSRLSKEKRVNRVLTTFEPEPMVLASIYATVTELYLCVGRMYWEQACQMEKPERTRRTGK